MGILESSLLLTQVALCRCLDPDSPVCMNIALSLSGLNECMPHRTVTANHLLQLLP